MAIYAGETVRIYADIAGWSGSPLTISDVSSATVAISDSDGNTVVEGGTMQWDTSTGRWLYQWLTPAVAGTYTAEVIMAVADGTTSIEVRKIRLDAPRRTPKYASSESSLPIWG